jgi:hypothetical protein
MKKHIITLVIFNFYFSYIHLCSKYKNKQSDIDHRLTFVLQQGKKYRRL